MFNRHYVAKFYSSGVKRLVSRLSIAKKIGYGYGVSIGISVLGTTIGLLVGDYYQRQAQQQHDIADRQQDLIYILENRVQEMRSHPQRLVTVLGQSIWFDYESSKFLGDVNRVQEVLSEFESFLDKNPNYLAINATYLRKLLNGYKTNTEAYKALVNSLWLQINPANVKPGEIEAAQQSLLTFLRQNKATRVGVEFDRLAESLTRIKNTAERQQIDFDRKVDQAEKIRTQIIVASIILSVAIAALLATITSRAIARPLVAVTGVANAIVKEANFNLRSYVTTEDEIASLATSLNQLVEWVGNYTQALELARQTLEQRVEERTMELRETLQQLQQTQTQLIQTEKMSSLGQMVAGIAHEINNPINFIYGNLQHVNQYAIDLLELIELYQQQYPHSNALIQQQMEAGDIEFVIEDLPRILSSMKMGAERIRQIVLSLRNFSRLDEAEKKAVDIHEGLENTLLILNHRISQQRIEIIKKYDTLPLVVCYPAQLNQVFMNIISNAIDALEESSKSCPLLVNEKTNGKKQLTTGWGKITLCTELTQNYITVRIGDNGTGITPEIKHKLFDPFFTTKPVGKGTGLGLSISYQIIEKHGGKIEVYSSPGQGTEFAIALPISR